MQNQKKADTMRPSTSKTALNGSIGGGKVAGTFVEMPTTPLNRFNILVAKEVIPEFKGDSKDLIAFLAVVGLLNDSMKSEDKPSLLDYVYYAKLSAEVRLAISIPNKPKNFAELKQNLCRRYKEFKPKNYIDKLKEDLHMACQGEMSVLEFREYLLQIYEKLAHEGIIKKYSYELGGIGDERKKEEELKELADVTLDRFKFGVNLPFNTKLSKCKTLDEAVEMVLHLENTQELNDMNSSDEDRALIEAGFYPIGYGLPKNKKNRSDTTAKEEKDKNEKEKQTKNKVEQSKQQKQQQQTLNVGYITRLSLKPDFDFDEKNNAASSNNNNNNNTNTVNFLCKNNYINVKCKNSRGREPLTFFLRTAVPFSVVKFHKVFARDVIYNDRVYDAPGCLGMEKIHCIGTIDLIMNLAAGVNLKFNFFVVNAADFPLHTDGMIGADFLNHHVGIYNLSKEIEIIHRGKSYYFPIVI